MREVDVQLLGGQVDVGEDHRPDRRLLEDLRPPPRRVAGVEQLAALEPQRFEHRHVAVEPFARAVIGVMVLIGPPDAVRVLPRLLNAPRAVARLPVLALRAQPQPARPVLPQRHHRPRHQRVGVVVPRADVVEGPPPCAERLQMQPRLA
jgi:hypothetical protein